MVSRKCHKVPRTMNLYAFIVIQLTRWIEDGAVNSEPIELGTIYLSDNSHGESSDEEMIDDESRESEVQDSSIQAAQTPSPKDTALHQTGTSGSPTTASELEVSSPGGMQIETRAMAAAKQNPSTETNTSGIQSEMKESSKRVNGKFMI